MNPLVRRGLLITNGVFVMLFAVAAYLQANDLDPQTYVNPSVADAWTWLLFYGFVSVLFAVSCFKPVPKWVLLIAALFCLVELGRTAAGFFDNLSGGHMEIDQSQMSAARPEVELSREFLGALITLLLLGFLYWQRAPRLREPMPAGE